MVTIEITNEVIAERKRQDDKWGGCEHDDKHQTRDREGDRLAAHVAEATRSPAESHWNKKQADERHDGAGHQRREEALDPSDDRGDRELDETADHHRAENRGDAHGLADGNHWGDEDEGGAHNDRQLGADESDAHRLQDGADAAGEQRPLNQNRLLQRLEAYGAADDERRRYHAGEHGDDVL